MLSLCGVRNKKRPCRISSKLSLWQHASGQLITIVTEQSFWLYHWNDRESHYSQAKIEIYGLWCTLQAYWLYIIGIRNIRVEIDASYIKGMLNNPDIQPGQYKTHLHKVI